MARITFERLFKELIEGPEIIHHEIGKVLKKAATKVRKDARAKFGVYQPGVGPYVPWAVLNTEYAIQKYNAGAPGDSPLIGYYFKEDLIERNKLGDKALRDSLEIKIDEHEMTAYVGTNNPLGGWHEYGLPSRKNPLHSRPFLRPALYQNQDWVHDVIRNAVGEGLVRWFK